MAKKVTQLSFLFDVDECLEEVRVCGEGMRHCEKHFMGKRFFHSGFFRVFEPESSAKGYRVELPSNSEV